MECKIDFDFEEKVVFEVEVKYVPGVMDTRWRIKTMPEALSEKFKNELWENLSVDVDKIEWMNGGDMDANEI